MNLRFLPISILILIPLPHSFAEDGLFPVLPSGYLTETPDRSLYISTSRGLYLGSADEDGNFIALGARRGGSAFGRINQDGTVLILYSPVDDSE
ncbi:hypothetical protein EBX31_15020 [bacterium]|nr:hypothetical protein [bacterium]